PIARITSMRHVPLGTDGGAMIELNLRDGTIERFLLGPDDEPFLPEDLTDIQLKWVRSAEVGRADPELDPLVPDRDDAEVVGSYRTVRRLDDGDRGPRTRTPSKVLEWPVAVAFAAAAVVTPILGIVVLPRMAIDSARASHVPNALRDVRR